MAELHRQECFCEDRVGVWPDVEISGRNSDSFYYWAVAKFGEVDGRLVIDLGKVEYVNAAGLGAMLKVTKCGSLQGISITWRNMSRNVANLVRLTGLDKVIEIAPRPCFPPAHYNSR